LVKLLKKSELQKLFDTGREVYAPVRTMDMVEYKKVETPDEVIFDFYNSKVPPKSVVFPQNEKMFEFEIKDNKPTDMVEVEPEIKDGILFAIRPCDARSFTYMDALFNWDGFEDTYYNRRREALTVFTLGCKKQPPNAFCQSIGGAPDSTEGADVFMFETDDALLLDGITDKGKALVESLALEDATGEMESAARAECKPPDPRSVDVTNIVEALDNKWDDAYWDTVANRCLSCGICVFLCPNCHCFDIQDTVSHGKGARCRIWDTCQFGVYTQHAGGHNPRPEKLNRTRNRILHKFNYIPKNFDGMFGCVGCGRCITYCPVNIDLVEILEEVQE